MELDFTDLQEQIFQFDWKYKNLEKKYQSEKRDLQSKIL